MTTTAGPPTNPEAAAARLRSALDADALGLLADDPLPAIPQLFDVRLELTDVDPRASGCSVHGTYFDDPPRITVVATASLRRRNFTALHELAHHLIALDDDLADALVVLPRGREAEEAVCDTFSASVLIPAGVLDATIPPAGPSAADVVGLYQRTQASRSACCAATARRLSGEGSSYWPTATGPSATPPRPTPASSSHPGPLSPPTASWPAPGAPAASVARGRSPMPPGPSRQPSTPTRSQMASTSSRSSPTASRRGAGWTSCPTTGPAGGIPPARTVTVTSRRTAGRARPAATTAAHSASSAAAAGGPVRRRVRTAAYLPTPN